jgi:hypothetical protein
MLTICPEIGFGCATKACALFYGLVGIAKGLICLNDLCSCEIGRVSIKAINLDRIIDLTPKVENIPKEYKISLTLIDLLKLGCIAKTTLKNFGQFFSNILHNTS